MAEDFLLRQIPPPLAVKRRYLLRIAYPASPAEILWNAMEYVVDEQFIGKVSKEYMGELRFEAVDERGLQFKKLGRIEFREIPQTVRVG